MRKIPCLFQRDFSVQPPILLDKVTPGCEWVAREGIATVKLDGSACLIEGGEIFARYDCKKGRTPPEGFRPCEPERDPKSGHWPGWVPCVGPQYKLHRDTSADRR